MFPILFKIGSVAIYSYGLMLAVAFIIATYLARKEAVRNNISEDIILELSSYILFAGIIGARVFYVALNFEEYSGHPIEILMLQRGGLSFYGGALGAFLAGVFFARRRKVSFLRIVDLVSPFLALGSAIGRIGCFLRGCCFGSIVNSGIRIKFPDEVVYRHPTQIYASIIDFILFFTLIYLYRKRHFDGKIFLLYLMLYSSKRLFLDFLRADVKNIYFGLTVFQIMSLVLLMLSFCIFIIMKRRQGKKQLH